MLYAPIPLLALLAVVLGGVEVAVRLLVPAHRDSSATAAGFVDPDPELLWRLRPHASGPLKTNELGFRDGPYRSAADAKVLVLGDSVTWGDGVRDPSRVYTAVLEHALQAADPHRTCEVINTGVPGYSTFQQGAYLRTRGLALKPHVIVLQFCLNDVVERYHSVASYGGDNVFLGVDTRLGGSGLRPWLIRHSRAAEHLARALQHRARRLEEMEVEKLATDDPSPAILDAWEQVERELDEIHALAAQHNLPLLIAIFPYRFQMEDPPALRQPQDRLLQYARERGIPCVDLLPAFAMAAAGGGPPLFVDENHLGREGHALAARVLAVPVRSLLERARLAAPGPSGPRPAERTP